MRTFYMLLILTLSGQSVVASDHWGMVNSVAMDVTISAEASPCHETASAMDPSTASHTCCQDSSMHSGMMVDCSSTEMDCKSDCQRCASHGSSIGISLMLVSSSQPTALDNSRLLPSFDSISGTRLQRPPIA